jgi:hypothetical protein
MTPDFLARVEAAEQAVHTAAATLLTTADPVQKCRLLWDLAWIELRHLEDFRPAGGFPTTSHPNTKP